jgi:hypothetical protein
MSLILAYPISCQSEISRTGENCRMMKEMIADLRAVIGIYDCAMFQHKSKAVPLQAWSGPEGSRKLRFPDYMTTARDGGKVVSLTHRPLPPGNAPGTHFS